jgi:hypothetical protein
MNSKENLLLGEKVQFIKRHLGIMSSFNPQEERQQARDFVLHYLKDDGVFLTRLLSINSSDLVVTEIINQLWLRYKSANRLYATVNPQRTIQIENNINTSIHGTNLNHHQRQKPSRIPPLLPPVPAYTNHSAYTKAEKSSKDTDV